MEKIAECLKNAKKISEQIDDNIEYNKFLLDLKELVDNKQIDETNIKNPFTFLPEKLPNNYYHGRQIHLILQTPQYCNRALPLIFPNHLTHYTTRIPRSSTHNSLSYSPTQAGHHPTMLLNTLFFLLHLTSIFPSPTHQVTPPTLSDQYGRCQSTN